MSNETKKLIEQATLQAPKEFMKVKRTRNLLGLAMFVIIVAMRVFENYLMQTISFCGFTIFQLFAVGVLFIWLGESWKCPVCYETPGFFLSNPKFCNECGTKLE